MLNAEQGRKPLMRPMAVASPQKEGEGFMVKTERITSGIGCTTLGELIAARYKGYSVRFGSAPMDTDITHGVEIETIDNSKQGYGIAVSIYPYIEWSDGQYRPCHYWGADNYICLEKR